MSTLINPLSRPIQAFLQIYELLPVSIHALVNLALFLFLVPLIYHLLRGVKG